MPQPIPASWQSPVMPRSPSALARHVTGGLLGLAVGLAIAVPGVLWYKGRIDPLALVGLTASDLGLAIAAPSDTSASKARAPAVETKRTAVAPVDVVRGPVPSVATTPREVPAVNVASVPREAPVLTPAPMPAPIVSVSPPPKTEAPRVETPPPAAAVVKPAPVEVAPPPPPVKPEVAMLDEARRLMGEGDVAAARRLLEDRTLANVPAARFLLAESYDPNFLAARGVRSVRAEVPRAIEHYKEALSGGIEAARQRLTALRP